MSSSIALPHPTTLLAPSGSASPVRPHRVPRMSERSDFLTGDTAANVEAFLAQALPGVASKSEGIAQALVPWICDTLLSNHSIKAYGRDLVDFLQHMKLQGVDAQQVTADHVKLYKRALLEAGMQRTTVARRLSVLRGAYKQLAAKGLFSWEIAQDIAAIPAPPGVEKNTTPALTPKQGIALLEAIPTDTLQGIRDFAMMSVFFITGCRVSGRQSCTSCARRKMARWRRVVFRSAYQEDMARVTNSSQEMVPFIDEDYIQRWKSVHG